MSKLVWDDVEDQTYETGVDRGILYVDGVIVPWNGLVSVSEKPIGGERTPYYIDGVLYLNLASDTEYSATIEAFTYPDEFSICDGTVELANGLLITNQEKKPFDFVYRTRIGNKLDGIDHGYKIHIVYNAYASPTQTTYNTLGEAVEPSMFSWEITTLPATVENYKPSAHFIIDSRKLSVDQLFYLHDLLYAEHGIYFSDPTFPTLSELTILLSNIAPTSGIFDSGFPEDVSPFWRDAGTLNTEANLFADGGVLGQL